MQITKEVLELAAAKPNHAQLLVMYKALEARYESVCAELHLVPDKLEDAFIVGYLSGIPSFCSDEDQADAEYLAHLYINRLSDSEQENS